MDVCRGENSSENQELLNAECDAETRTVTRRSVYMRNCRQQHRQESIRHPKNHHGSTENVQGDHEKDTKEKVFAHRAANAERMRKNRARIPPKRREKRLAECNNLEDLPQGKGNVLIAVDEIEENWAQVHAEIAEYQKELREGHCAKDSQEMDSLQRAADSLRLRANIRGYRENQHARETIEKAAACRAADAELSHQSRERVVPEKRKGRTVSRKGGSAMVGIGLGQYTVEVSEEGTTQDGAHVACTQLDKMPNHSGKEYGEETKDNVGLTAKAIRMRKYRERIAAEETEEQAAERRARERARHRMYRMRTTVEQSTEEEKQRKVRAAQRSRKYRQKLAVIQTADQIDEQRALKAMHMRKLRRERIRQETEEEKALRLSANAERMRKYRQSRRNRKVAAKRRPVTRSTITCKTCADFKLESKALQEKCESYKRLVAEQSRVNANSFRLLKASKKENDNLTKTSQLQRQHTENVLRLPGNEMEKLQTDNLPQTKPGNDSTADEELRLCLDTSSYEEVTVKVEPEDLLPNEWDVGRESERDEETDVNNDGINMEC